LDILNCVRLQEPGSCEYENRLTEVKVPAPFKKQLVGQQNGKSEPSFLRALCVSRWKGNQTVIYVSEY